MIDDEECLLAPTMSSSCVIIERDSIVYTRPVARCRAASKRERRVYARRFMFTRARCLRLRFREYATVAPCHLRAIR